jgi:alpha-glucosidase
VLSNHDVTRPVTRYGRADTSFAHGGALHGAPSDPELGYRRARAAALLAMALPGGLYVYQGEELGLPEVEDLPDELRQDPMYARSGGANPGRDGCRVPLPWSGDEPPFGFSPDPVRPWLPQPESWRKLSAEAQLPDLDSMLNLYRAGLRLRRSLLGDGTLSWLPYDPTVLAFTRDSGLTCVTNLGAEAVPLPAGEILLTSGPLEDGALPPDTTAWLAPPG